MKKHLFALLLLASMIQLAMPSSAQKTNLTLEDIWGSRKFVAFGLMDVRSMNDGLHYSELTGSGDAQSIVKMSFATGKTVDTLFKKISTPLQETVEEYTFSNDESLILVATESEPIYRHSTKANHHVFNRTTGKLTPVSEKGKQQYATVDASGKPNER
jgi:dipeptidyl-peptidase-4